MPHLRRHHRLGLSLWLVVALLFTQLASAAYACPQQQAAALVVSGTAPAAAAAAPDSAAMVDMTDMADCDGMMMTATPDGPLTMDPAQPQLCKLHCSPTSQTVQASVVLDVPSAPLLLLAVLDWAPAAQLPAQEAVLARQLVPSGAAPPGAPPLYLSLLVLRH